MEKATFRVGTSTHQHIGDNATVALVFQQLRELLSTHKQQAIEHGQNIVACSALAVGTDQLFISIALKLAIPVEVVIPFAQYAEIFPTDFRTSVYNTLCLHFLEGVAGKDTMWYETGEYKNPETTEVSDATTYYMSG